MKNFVFLDDSENIITIVKAKNHSDSVKKSKNPEVNMYTDYDEYDLNFNL